LNVDELNIWLKDLPIQGSSKTANGLEELLSDALGNQSIIEGINNKQKYGRSIRIGEVNLHSVRDNLDNPSPLELQKLIVTEVTRFIASSLQTTGGRQASSIL